jgi:hypothetical protein
MPFSGGRPPHQLHNTGKQTMTWIITGLFNKRGDAERAIEHLVQELDVDPKRVEVYATSGAKPRRALTQQERHSYDEAVRRGGIVVSAEINEQRLSRAMSALKECGSTSRRTRRR